MAKTIWIPLEKPGELEDTLGDIPVWSVVIGYFHTAGAGCDL